MFIHAAEKDGLVQASGMARDVYALLGLLLIARVERITVCVYGSGMSVTWGL
jgi:hypothetical protein